jgi:ABC-type polysaccharide/polyol phosphate export permease
MVYAVFISFLTLFVGTFFFHRVENSMVKII